MCGQIQTRSVHRPRPRGIGATATGLRMLFLCLGLLACAAPAASQPLTEGRSPLLDLAARAEVDGYARLDEMTTRSAALPNVFDPAEYASSGAASLKADIQAHRAWLDGARAAHLDRVETLPAGMRAVETSEPYKDELVAEVAAMTPERRRLVAACYDRERQAAEAQWAFLSFIEASDVLVGGDGFTFTTEQDVIEYSDHVAEANAAFEARDRCIGGYYAWELRQKARLRRYRDRL